ncbi:MAG: NAD(P)/FAD-dependent oxidoreductase [Fidelibacterota bacterium]|nr:MAG: NAD(P)/FAD-dependent oxidoreductase [Candidatus Neomarinimicrobiota bacterium]
MLAQSNHPQRRTGRETGPTRRSEVYDVVVVGAGPSGSVMAWSLARKGMSVLVLERARLPREKVCGDFIEPRGLRILKGLGCLESLQEATPLQITRVAIYLQSQCVYRGKIPFYGQRSDLPPYAYIIPRLVLDYHVLQCAIEAGAIVREESAVKAVKSTHDGVEIKVQHRSQDSTYRANIVVGADGAHSIVAKSAGLLNHDPRYMTVAQRAYGEGLSENIGEAAFFVDQDLFPGYGWMFPMVGGKANIGVGILSETRDRYKINVRQLFFGFIEKLRRVHPFCADLCISSGPLGGIVKTYGGAGQNYFNRGILIGDAGCFVEPMTGEGITAAMESALIGSSIITAALEQGRFDAAFLSSYEQAFRRYFDPALCYEDLCATLMRNRHFSDSWLKAIARGYELAQKDEHFARISGAGFGGMEVDPLNIAAQIWVKIIGVLTTHGSQSPFSPITGETNSISANLSDLAAWQASWWRSVASDPIWHTSWAMDISQKWLKLITTIPGAAMDPRANGLLL